MDLFDTPVLIEENYECIGRANHYKYIQKNDFVDSEYFAPMAKYCNSNYALSRVDQLSEIVKSHEKYAEPCLLRDVAFIESFDKTTELDDLLWRIFGKHMIAPMMSDENVIGIQELKKGSGCACSSLKATCWHDNPFLLLEVLKNPSLMLCQIPIWVLSGKLEVRDVSKPCRCYMIAPMWMSAVQQKFTKLQNLTMMAARFKIPSAVGMRVPEDWYELYTRLHEYEEPDYKIKFFLSDIKLWDSVQYRSVLWRTARLRCRALGLTGEEKKLFFHYVYWTINRVVLLPDGELVLTKDGNASGKPDTTFDNGINQIQMHAMLWHDLYGTFSGFEMFLHRAKEFTNGDDIISACVNAADETFYRALPGLWKKRFGSEMKSELVEEWSAVHFLGAQPLSSVWPGCVLVKPYDIPRQMANLVHKGNKPSKFDPFIELQRGFGHRNLLAATCVDPIHEELDTLKKCMADLIADYSPVMSKNQEWNKLVPYHHMSDLDYFLNMIPRSPLVELDTRQQQLRAPLSLNDVRAQKDDFMSFLSKKEWTANKAAKLAGLSKEEISLRYDTYKQSVTANPPGRTTLPKRVKLTKKQVTSALGNVAKTQKLSSVARPSSGTPSMRSVSQDVFAQNAFAHAMSLLNPWSEEWNGAKCPSEVPLDSTVFKTHEILTAGCPPAAAADQFPNQTPNQVFAGFGGFVMRPNALGRQYQYTSGNQYLGWNVASDFTQAPGLVALSGATSDQSLVLNMMGNLNDESFAAPANSNTDCAWLAPEGMGDIQNLCSKFRVVSAGLVFRYTGPTISNSGLIAAGVVPYDLLQSIEQEYLPAELDFFTTITWDSFINLKDTVTGPASKGINMVYVPKDDRAYQWKETIMTYMLPYSSATGVPTFNSDGTPKRKKCPPWLSAGGVRKLAKKGRLQAIVRAFRDNGVDAKFDVQKGTVNLGTAAKITKTIDHTGRTVKKDITFPGRSTSPPPTPTAGPIPQGIDPVDYYMVQAFAGEFIPDVLPQPEDSSAGMVKTFIQSLYAGIAVAGNAYNQVGGSFVDGSIMQFMDCNWDESEDLMVVMWNGIAPADAILNNNISTFWAGNIYEVDKYVNYECQLDLNSLTIGSMPASPGSQGSAGAGLQIAKGVLGSSTAKVGAPMTPQSSMSKIGNFVKDVAAKAPGIANKALEYGGIAMDIIGAIGALF
jgi:hypothetical protein